MGKLIWWYQILCLVLLLHVQVNCSSSFSSLSPKLPKNCPPKESFALLQFKNSFSIDNSTNFCDASYPKTETWEEGTDCCTWDGVICDELTGHVIGLDLSCSWLHGSFPSNSTLFVLSHLQRLNLAFNNFIYSPLPSKLSLLVKLTHLNLSMSEFFGQISPEISMLSKLVSLDLAYNDFLHFDIHSFEKLSQNLTQLRILHLSRVNMSLIPLMYLLNLSSSLRSLHLQGCSLGGKLPNDFFRFPWLKVLDISGNINVMGNFPKSNWSSPIRSLILSDTSLWGELPNSIGNLKSLEFLDLTGNNFFGSIPASLGYLEQLKFLGLSYNNFAGHIPDIFGNLSTLVTLSLSSNNFSGRLPFSLFNLTQLYSLDFSSNQLVGPLPCSISDLSKLHLIDLSYNTLSGRIPYWLFTMPSLHVFHLGNNKLNGPIEQFQKPNSVQEVHLQNNEIQGPIPSSIFELVNLTYLDLSSNNLSGIVEWNMLQMLKNLKVVNLSMNSELSLRTGSNVNFTLPNLESMDFSSCNKSEFPNSLRTMSNLETLDLSTDRIHGQISKQESKGRKLLDNLDESLPVPPPSTQSFMISENKLSGEIPSSICNLTSLEILDLSDNNFSGVIPQCLSNFSNALSVLNLRNNNFHSSIPGAFAKSNNLKHLSLNGNQFVGPIPRSLINCTSLEVLDLGNNKINDTFPHWLEGLPELKVLILRSNSFHGIIGHPKTMFPFRKLQILDLSHNEFIGLLPTKYLQNLRSMMNVDAERSDKPKYVGDGYFSLVVEVTMKGLEIEMKKILTIFKTIDLSSNRFQGEIPELVGQLKSLIVLNFSHNSLTGHIPLSLANLTELESLDLSSNKLFGVIPQQLTVMTFLAVLNLSYNQLVGRIPEGNQFSTFTNSSYIGNSGLCGLPLSKKCNGEPPQLLSPSSHMEEDSTSWLDWNFAAMGYGCGLVFGLSMGYIVFTTGKPQWFIRLVEGKEKEKLRRSIPRNRRRRN